jgi:hypothetical protein
MQGAAGTMSSQQKSQTTETKEKSNKSVGGALASGVSGALSGAMMQNYLYPSAASSAKVGGGAASMAATGKDAAAVMEGLESGYLPAGGYTGLAADVASSVAANETAAMAASSAASSGAGAAAAAGAGADAAKGASFGPWGAAAGFAIGLLSYYL